MEPYNDRLVFMRNKAFEKGPAAALLGGRSSTVTTLASMPAVNGMMAPVT